MTFTQSEITSKSLQYIEDIYTRSNLLMTDFEPVDKVAGGFARGCLHLLISDKKCKYALMVNLISNIVFRENNTESLLVWQRNYSPAKICSELILHKVDSSLEMLQAEALSTKKWGAIQETANFLETVSVHLADQKHSEFNLNEFITKNEVKVVIVDYALLSQGTEDESVLYDLDKVAFETNTTVIVIGQCQIGLTDDVIQEQFSAAIDYMESVITLKCEESVVVFSFLSPENDNRFIVSMDFDVKRNCFSGKTEDQVNINGESWKKF